MPRGTRKQKMVSADPKECFWTNHGPIAHDLKSLARILREETTDEQFKYHVGKGGSDYAAWVKHTLGDTECARKLSRIKTRKTAFKTLDECLKGYH